MGDRLCVGIPPRYVTKPTRSTQPCIPSGSLNRVPALIGWGKGGNVTSAGWQVTLCDPVWHVTSRSGEAVCKLLCTRYLLTYLALTLMVVALTCKVVVLALALCPSLSPQQQLTKFYLDQINNPARFDPQQQCLQQLFGVKDYEALKALFLHILSAPQPAISVVRHWQCCVN